MSRKKIAIDMDDVLTPTGLYILDYLNEIKGTNYKNEDFDELNYYKMVSDQEQKLIHEFINRPGFFRNLTVMEDAQETVVKLQDKYDVFIVSAATQFPNSLKEKYEWLAEFFPTISWKNIVLCGDKSIINADIMIDDHSYNFKGFGGQVYLFDALHNRHETEYERVYNWKQVEDLLL